MRKAFERDGPGGRAARVDGSRRAVSTTDVAERRKGHGYALLEVLMALTVMGMVLAALIGHTHFGVRLFTEVQAQAEEQTWKAGLAVVERLLRDARQVHGDERRLAFVSQMPLSLEAPGLYFVELRAGVAGGLTLSSRPRSDGPRDEAEGRLDELPLIGASARVRFKFLDNGATRSAWQSERREPGLVEISVDHVDGGRYQARVAPLFGRM